MRGRDPRFYDAIRSHADYSGDSWYAPTVQSITVAANIPTTLTFTSSHINAGVGQPIVFTATVTPAVGTSVPTGHVLFYKNFKLFGTDVQESQAITFAFALAVTIALTAFFRVARRGKAMRAVVDNPELLDI